MVVVLLVAAAGDVVGEDPALAAVEVVPGEERDDGQALHGHAEVGPDHRGEPVRLALQRQQRALDLLVVLELDLEELDQLDRDAGGAGDADGGVLVGREDLLHVAVGDDVAHGGPAVAGHHHAAVEGGRDDRRAVRRLERAACGQRTARGQQVRGVRADEVGERGRTGREVCRGQPPSVGPRLTGRPSGRSRGRTPPRWTRARRRSRRARCRCRESRFSLRALASGDAGVGSGASSGASSRRCGRLCSWLPCRDLRCRHPARPHVRGACVSLLTTLLLINLVGP